MASDDMATGEQAVRERVVLAAINAGWPVEAVRTVAPAMADYILHPLDLGLAVPGADLSTPVTRGEERVCPDHLRAGV